MRVRMHDPGASRTLQIDSIASDKCRLLACTQGFKFPMANDDPEEFIDKHLLPGTCS